MVTRSVLIVTIALVVGIAAFVLHLLALCSPYWKITKRDREPIIEPVSYGIWKRCEYTNVTVIRQGVTIGPLTNVQFCYPNYYMRYSPDNYTSCYPIRRRCSVLEKHQLPKGCSCRYLTSAKVLQWLTVIAAIFLVLGLILLYLKIIASPQNDSALLLLSYGPFIFFLLTLLLMVSGLVLLGAYFRRDTYEDFSFPLQSILDSKREPQSFDLHSLHNYAKHHGEAFSRENYIAAERELRDDANSHYHTIIGLATIYELIATVLILINTALTFWIGILAKSEDL